MTTPYPIKTVSIFFLCTLPLLFSGCPGGIDELDQGLTVDQAIPVDQFIAQPDTGVDSGRPAICRMNLEDESLGMRMGIRGASPQTLQIGIGYDRSATPENTTVSRRGGIVLEGNDQRSTRYGILFWNTSDVWTGIRCPGHLCLRTFTAGEGWDTQVVIPFLGGVTSVENPILFSFGGRFAIAADYFAVDARVIRPRIYLEGENGEFTDHELEAPQFSNPLRATEMIENGERFALIASRTSTQWILEKINLEGEVAQHASTPISGSDLIGVGYTVDRGPSLFLTRTGFRSDPSSTPNRQDRQYAFDDDLNAFGESRLLFDTTRDSIRDRRRIEFQTTPNGRAGIHIYSGFPQRFVVVVGFALKWQFPRTGPFPGPESAIESFSFVGRSPRSLDEPSLWFNFNPSGIGGYYSLMMQDDSNRWQFGWANATGSELEFDDRPERVPTSIANPTLSPLLTAGIHRYECDGTQYSVWEYADSTGDLFWSRSKGTKSTRAAGPHDDGRLAARLYPKNSVKNGPYPPNGRATNDKGRVLPVRGKTRPFVSFLKKNSERYDLA